MYADYKDPVLGGVRPKDIRVIFKFIVQAVLLFGSETRVLTPGMERSQGSFQLGGTYQRYLPSKNRTH